MVQQITKQLISTIAIILTVTVGMILIVAFYVVNAEEVLPPNAIVISAEDISQGLYGYDLFDVLAILRQQVGVTVKSSSDIGAEDWLLIRGLPRDSARNILVLIDGMPLNDALSGSNEFEHLPPLELIDRIILYKPPLPARFGGATAAIEILTKGVPQTSTAEVAGAYGDYKSGFLSAHAKGTRERLAYHGFADYLNTDNLTGVRRTSPRQQIVYGDRSYWIAKPAIKIAYDHSTTFRPSLYTQYVTSRKFYSSDTFRGEREFRERDLLDANLTIFSVPRQGFDLHANLFRTDESYTMNLKMHPDVRDQDRFTQGGRLNGSWSLPGKQHLSFGGDITHAHVEERLGTPVPLDRVTFGGWYIEDQIIPRPGVILTGGIRFDNHSEAGSHWSPSLSAVYRPVKPTQVYALWGRSVRWPGLSEFAEQAPRTGHAHRPIVQPGLSEAVESSEGLQGERIETFEGGIEHEIVKGRLTAKVATFRLNLKDESQLSIDITQNPPLVFWKNADDEVRSDGIEVTVNMVPIRKFQGFANYTYNLVERRPAQIPVAYGGPQHVANAGVMYLSTRAMANIIVRYGGQVKGVQAEGGKPTELDRWIIVDLAGSRQIVTGLEVFLRVGNLFDTIYETFDGRPMFGRTTIGGVTVRL